MRRCVALMFLFCMGVWGGCSREEARVNEIDVKIQGLIAEIEQNYRAWNSRVSMARFEKELLALPEKSDRIRCVQQYLEMIRSKIEMVKNPKDCINKSHEVFKLTCHGCDMMNHVEYTNDEKMEFLSSFLVIVRDQIENLQSLGPVGTRIEQLERPHYIKNLKLQMLSWEEWTRLRIINGRTYGFNEEERARYLARLNELMKVTQGWRDPVSPNPTRSSTNDVIEIEVDI